MAAEGNLRQGAQRCRVLARLLLALALGLASVGCVTAFPEGQHWPEHAKPSVAPLSDADLHLALLKGAQARWSDPALVSSATAMRRWVGMALYEQVCWTISRYHVDVFSYSDLLRLGLGNLRAALDAEEFLKMSPRAGDAAAAEEFKAAIRRIERAVARAPPKSLRTLRRWVLLVLAENDRTVELPAGAVLAELVFGSANRLDGFSLYFTHEMLAVFKEALRGRYVGVGIEVAREDD
ncbi:MAG: hypothetical protein QGD94_12915, partial [Planctomycetia bacterium]|nr:hypothetical protein [Planctomycetia bacterium]